MEHDFKKFPELTNSQMDFYYFKSPHKQIFDDFVGKVVAVTDGDTIKLETNFRDFNFPLRMAEIAAPELKERGGVESKKWLSSKLENQTVDIIINQNNRVGRWGRLIGRVIFQGLDVGEESMNMGFSVPFNQRKEKAF